MATITSQPIEEQVLYWIWSHLDADKATGGVDLVRRSRRAPVGKDDGTIVNITPQATRPEDGTVNAGWTSTGRSNQRWEMEIEISVARARWPTDDVYGNGERLSSGFAPESSVASATAWIEERLRANYLEGSVGYPSGATDQVKGNIVSDVSLDEIRWAFADRDQGEVVALMRYRVEYHLG